MSTRRKLTRAERKQIEAAIARAKKQDKKHKSAQDSIPFQRMFPDGICRVSDKYYTKTVQFQDINYQLNQNEDKTAIFDGWCDFLNYFDSSVRFQLSFNAVAESFFATLKREMLYRYHFRSVKEMKHQLEKYIVFYNTKRLHKALNHKAPCNVEAKYYAMLKNES